MRGQVTSYNDDDLDDDFRASANGVGQKRFSELMGPSCHHCNRRNGKLYADIAKQSRDNTVSFVTPAAEARVLGTTLNLLVEDETTRLDVPAGSVRLTSIASGETIAVENGQRAVVRKGGPLVRYGTGTGLRGEYFVRMDFSGDKFERLDLKVNFNWDVHRPHPKLPAEKFSIRWTGWLEPQFSETYAFHTTSDDGVPST